MDSSGGFFVDSLDSCGFLWILAVDSLWILVDSCGFLWIIVDFLWIFVDSCGFLVDSCGFLWILVDFPDPDPGA